MSENSTFQNFTYRLGGEEIATNYMRVCPDQAFILPFSFGTTEKGLIAGHNSIIQGLPPDSVNRQAWFYRHIKQTGNFQVIPELSNTSMSSELKRMSISRHIFAAFFMPLELSTLGLDKVLGNKNYYPVISPVCAAEGLFYNNNQPHESNLKFQVSKSVLDLMLLPTIVLTGETNHLLHEGQQTPETKTKIINALPNWLNS